MELESNIEVLIDTFVGEMIYVGELCDGWGGQYSNYEFEFYPEILN